MTKNTQVYEAVAQECSRLTRSVVDRQNVERKLVLGGIKHTQCRHVHLTHRWRDLMETLTHERATWHFQHSYPRLVMRQWGFLSSDELVARNIDLSCNNKNKLFLSSDELVARNVDLFCNNIDQMFSSGVKVVMVARNIVCYPCIIKIKYFSLVMKW